MTQTTGEIVTSIDALVDALNNTITPEIEGMSELEYSLDKVVAKDLIRDFIDRYNAGKP